VLSNTIKTNLLLAMLQN